MHRVFLSIGSNLGDKKDNCFKAVKMLADEGLKIIKVSSSYNTKAWGYKNQPDFVNIAVECYTEMQPEQLLTKVKEIEKAMGREKSFKWGPRIIDIDILFYDDVVINTELLKIPHPYIPEREFVLRPMAEIAPDFIHPVLKKDIQTLLKELNEVR